MGFGGVALLAESVSVLGIDGGVFKPINWFPFWLSLIWSAEQEFVVAAGNG